MRGNNEAIRAIRERSGLSQSAVYTPAGIDAGNYSKIESGQRPGTAAQLKKIAEALQVPVTAITHSDAAGVPLDERRRVKRTADVSDRRKAAGTAPAIERRAS